MPITKKEYHEKLLNAAEDGTFPSITGIAICLYRGKTAEGKTTACAFGILIPDEKYKPEYEGKPIRHLPQQLVAEITPIGMTNTELVTVQYLHDKFAQAGWDKKKFIDAINELPFFQDCQHEEQQAQQ